MAHDIRGGMQVIGSDGGMVGEVDELEGNAIKLKRAAEAGGGQHHFIPTDWVDHVDDHVHLNIPAATVRDRWTAAAPVGAYAAAPVEAERKTNWIPWLIGLVLLAIVLILGMRGCDYANNEPDYEAGKSGVEGMAEESGAASATVAAVPLSQAGAYLAGTEATPRTFAFERLNFDTSSAEIREQDRDEVAELGTLLAGSPAARVRIVGYADARGSDPANQALGQQRADAVKAALVAAGTEAGRIETASGGEEAPAATNATAEGQFENRRTEVIFLSR